MYDRIITFRIKSQGEVHGCKAINQWSEIGRRRVKKDMFCKYNGTYPFLRKKVNRAIGLPSGGGMLTLKTKS